MMYVLGELAVVGLPSIAEVELIGPSVADAVELLLDERADGNVVERRSGAGHPTALEKIASDIDRGRYLKPNSQVYKLVIEQFHTIHFHS